MNFANAARVAAAVCLSTRLLAAVENSPAETYAKQGEELFRIGEYKQAEKAFKKAVQLDPANPDFHDKLGRTYEREAEASSVPFSLTAKARRSFVRALELRPYHAGALADLIELDTQPVGLCQGDLAEATNLIERLDSVDANAAERGRMMLEDAIKDSQRPGQKSLCGPVKASRLVTQRVFPVPAVPRLPKQQSHDSVVAENGQDASDSQN